MFERGRRGEGEKFRKVAPPWDQGVCRDLKEVIYTHRHKITMKGKIGKNWTTLKLGPLLNKKEKM